jgi:hypothetical protein
MRIILTSNMTAITRLVICAALDGAAKNRRTVRRYPAVRVVYEKSKNPDPRECMPGGLTKIETRSSAHQRKVMMRKNTVKYLRNRTLQRLYGDTCLQLATWAGNSIEKITHSWVIRA